MKLKKIIVLLLLFILIFIVSCSDDSKVDSAKDTSGEKEEVVDNRIRVKGPSKMFLNNGELFVLEEDFKLKKVDWSDRLLVDSKDVYPSLYDVNDGNFYMDGKSVYFIDTKKKLILEDVDEYKFYKYNAVFRVKDKLFSYSYETKVLSPILENIETPFIKNLNNFFVTGKGKYYAYNNVEENTLVVNELVTDINVEHKEGIVYDAKVDEAKFIMSRDPSSFQDIMEFNIETSVGSKYVDLSINEKILSNPRYYEDGRIFFLTSFDSDVYLKVITQENAKLKKFKLGKEADFVNLEVLDSTIIVAFKDRFYHGNVDKLSFFKKTYDKITIVDDMFMLNTDKKLSVIKGNKIKEYDLKGVPTNYVYGSGKYYYIYKDVSVFYIDEVDIDF